MKRRILCLLLVFALILNTNIGATKAEAAVTIPVEVLPNKTLFNILRCSVKTSITDQNYKANNKGFFNTIGSYVYSQEKLRGKMWVGLKSFADVGCELAACYNATYRLTGSVTAGALPELIKIAEKKGHTMAITSSAINKVSAIAGYVGGVVLGIAVKVLLTEKLADYSQYSFASSFGTDPYAIPSILNARGYVKAKDPLNYSKMNTAVNNAKNNKEKRVFIVSFWNYSTLNACMKGKSGFHTVCFYTENGNIYDLNNGYSSSPRPVTNLSQIIGGYSSRFIVGYEIVKK